MLEEMSFDEFEKQDAEQKAKNQTVVFVNGKGTNGEGLTFRPFGGLYKVVSFFDQELKINRAPRAGEKASTKYLIRGLDRDRNAKVFQAGVSVISRIKEIRNDADTEDLYVTVTSTGAGMSTEYATKRNKSINGKITKAEVEALLKHDLVKIGQSLVKPDPATQPQEPVAAATSTDMAEAPWGQ